MNIYTDMRYESERKVTILLTWQMRKGRNASYWRLAEALCRIGRQDLVCIDIQKSDFEEESPLQCTELPFVSYGELHALL